MAFWEFTSASVLAIGLGIFIGALATRLDGTFTRQDFASMLVVVWSALIGSKIGFNPGRHRVRHGHRCPSNACALVVLAGAALVRAIAVSSALAASAGDCGF